MSIYSIYFSPTGGTKKVMDILAGELHADKEIDLSVPDEDYGACEFHAGDVCLVGVPSFGGRVPELALVHIRKMQVENAVAIPVIVYGNRAYDDTMLELENELIACGFKVPAALAAVAEHSIMHQYGAGRPDAQDIEELKHFAQQLKSLIGKVQSDPAADMENIHVPGAMPYREYHGVPFKPTANKNCNHCGLCASKCPACAIPADHPESVDEALCISCMRCVTICPQQARPLNKLLLAGASAKLKKACSTRKENELYI